VQQGGGAKGPLVNHGRACSVSRPASQLGRRSRPLTYVRQGQCPPRWYAGSLGSLTAPSDHCYANQITNQVLGTSADGVIGDCPCLNMRKAFLRPTPSMHTSICRRALFMVSRTTICVVRSMHA
jgi:hypothetical protein